MTSEEIVEFMKDHKLVTSNADAAEALGVDLQAATQLITSSLQVICSEVLKVGNERVFLDISSGEPVAMHVANTWFYAVKHSIFFPLEIFGKSVLFSCSFAAKPTGKMT
jgi:hypothetical protein